MIRDYIPIESGLEIKDEPYQQPITIDGVVYNLIFYFNQIDYQFYVDTYDIDMNPIKLGEPLILNQPLWHGISDTRLPLSEVVPMDESGNETDVNPANLGNTVQLCIDDVDEDDING